MTSEIDWRRRWKPELKTRPWQSFRIEDEKFLVKASFTEDEYEFLISDYRNMWYEHLDKEGIKKRSQKLNPSVEAPVSKLLDHVQIYIEAQKKDTKYSVAFKEIDDEDQQKILFTVNTSLAGLPFVWKFMGNPASCEMISDNLTVPLLAMVGELQRQQEELYKLLRNKDKEINDLKAQHVTVSRKHLETPVFDDLLFRTNMATSKGFEDQVRSMGHTAFNPEGQELYRNIMTKHAWIHRNPTNAAEGESLMEDESVDDGASPGGATGQSWTNRIPGSLAGTSRVSPNVSPQKSPARNVKKSPEKSPVKPAASPAAKDSELIRRQALERRLQEEAEKKQGQKGKKKKKIKF